MGCEIRFDRHAHSANVLYLSSERISQTIDIVKHTVSIEEKGIKLRLTIIDTPGFGDAVNNTDR